MLLSDAAQSSLTGQERPLLEGKGMKRRIVLISNFLQQAAGDANDPFLEAVMDRLSDRDILLEIISVDVKEQDAQQQADKDFNTAILKTIMQQAYLLLTCQMQAYQKAADVALFSALLAEHLSHCVASSAVAWCNEHPPLCLAT